MSCWPLPEELDDTALQGRLNPQAERQSEHVQPDWETIIADYKTPRRRRARLTQHRLWTEYSEEAVMKGGTPYSCSQFCALLKEQLQGQHADTQIRFDYAPGHCGVSDFSGKTLPVRTATAEIDVEIFVAVLPHSNLVYAEAVPSQKTCHWAMAHRRAMEYFGGTPTIWIAGDVPVTRMNDLLPGRKDDTRPVSFGGGRWVNFG